MDSWNQNKNFKDLLKKNKSIKSFLSHKEIDKIFELEYHFKNINHIFKKLTNDAKKNYTKEKRR